MPEPLLPVFDTYQSVSLHFSRPQRDDFQEFFETVGRVAGLETQPQAVEDDLFYRPVNDIFPLPDELRTQLPVAATPYVGLKPFSRAEARLFFGRSREIYRWCYRISREEEPRLLVLDGYSGTGKSSLLQAGIIPRLEAQGWAVAYGRREEDKIQGLSGVCARLQAELEAQASARKLLILDQVEEAITNPIDVRPRELAELAEDLQVLLADHPDWKVLLSFHSEYMARISQLLREHELSFGADHTLFPLDRAGILEAVQSVVNEAELRAHYRLHFVPPSLPQTIANRLADRAGYHIAPLIQVNLELLWEKCRQANGSVRINQQAIQAFIEDHADLLQHYLGKIRESITEGYADDLAILQLLNYYVEEKPAAATRLEADFAQHPDFGQQERFQKLRRELERLYLLSATGEGTRRAARLTHDVLATTISQQYLAVSQRQLRRREEQSFELLFERLPTQIYGAQHAEAQETLDQLMELGIRRSDLRPYLYELTFFWNAAGQAPFVGRNVKHWLDSGLLSEAARHEAAAFQEAPETTAVDQWLAKLDPKAHTEMSDRYLIAAETYLVRVAGGSFVRNDREYSVPTFYLANVPVTFWKYSLYVQASEAEMPEAPRWGIRGDHPVVKVNWHDARAYCNWLNERYDLPTDRGFRLPSEAEWEYAARGGRYSNRYKYAGGNELDQVGWYNKNSEGQTQPVGLKQANEIGLYDMSGNVREWCADHWKGNEAELPRDGRPHSDTKSDFRLVRGGSWYNDGYVCRVSYRFRVNTGSRYYDFGFRVARY